MKPDIALIGPGKVGCAVSQRLYQAGFEFTAVIGRRMKSATDACQFIGCPVELATTDIMRASQAQVIFLAVPDDQIESVAAKLHAAPYSLTGKTLVHFSGLHQASGLQRDDKAVAAISIHPLLPFADRTLASQRLTDCPCALEGDSSSIDLGRQLISAFGGRVFQISSEKKSLYHTAASIASNHLVSLLAGAETLLTECGIPPKDGLSLLAPLVRATLENVIQLGPEKGLTGPIVRGDVLTVAHHIEALKKTSPEQLASYLLLAQQTLSLALRANRLNAETAQELNLVLKNAELALKEDK